MGIPGVVNEHAAPTGADPDAPPASRASGNGQGATPAAPTPVTARGATPRSAIAPRTAWQLEYRTKSDYSYVAFAADWHDLRSNRWAVVDTWIRLVVAVSASFSALSLFAQNAIATGILATATALVSALNAAVDPSQRATRHRKAAKDYRHHIRLLSGLVGNIDSILETKYQAQLHTDPTTGEVRDEGYYYQGEMSEQDRIALTDELMALEDGLETVDDASPPISRLLARRPDGVPLTKLGLWRYEALAKRTLAYQKLRKHYEPLLNNLDDAHGPLINGGKD